MENKLQKQVNIKKIKPNTTFVYSYTDNVPYAWRVSLNIEKHGVKQSKAFKKLVLDQQDRNSKLPSIKVD
ncbi:MAG: hypothetical protein LBU60_00685 [Clostridiales bacterium]|jgi:hypothetical protein|nr:hypothetical protein [Clostridiales bacterium]